MPLPTARAVPTALLTNAGRRQPKETLPGIDQLLHADSHAIDAGPSSAQPVPRQLQSATDQESPAFLYEFALTAAAMAFHGGAIEALRDCVAVAPDHGPAWSKLAELLRLAREDAQADAAEAAAKRGATDKWPAAVGGGNSAQIDKAEAKLRKSLDSMRLAGKTPAEGMELLRQRLAADPLDTPAMRLLAQLERLDGDEVTSLRLLERALDLCPSYIGAREDYAALLTERNAHAAAAAQTAKLVAHAPRNVHYRNLHAWAMANTGQGDAAAEMLTGLLHEYPGEPRFWLLYAQLLHFLGRMDESVQAYRQCLALKPSMGEAYWGLADLKGSFIGEADIVAMRVQLEDDALEPDGRRRMLYAMGQALERMGDFEGAFAAYDEGARVALTNRKGTGNDRDKSTVGDGSDVSDSRNRVHMRKVVFSRENFETKFVQAPATATGETPIFIIGMPRAGSTLTEQILASHSQVEGTRELSLIGDIVRDLGHTRMMVMPNAYPECVLDLSQNQLATLGTRYIERSRAYRKTERLWFIDKRPWNWLEVGLIHLILPQAKFIDIRREPMAACFAMFKQLLPNFALGLDGLGRYYNKYVRLMEHWEAVLPGRVHFVQYERLVDNTETEIRRMLDYCGLPFEDGCLRFWETDRVVATPSAQQVRRPIYRNALEQWRNFEPWLGPLKEALAQPADV